jgi:D-erythronate 2-dehydrogenase
MKVVVTGGAGFLGRRLAQALLDRGEMAGAAGQSRRIERIVLFDHAEAAGLEDERVEIAAGDIADPATVAGVIEGAASVFHLAAVVSGEAEADFDIGMRVNLDGTRNVLEACRAQPSPARLVFTSSLAVFGGKLPDVVPDAQTPLPQGSYGVQKVIGEYLVQDYSRKGFVDGRSVRLPTVVVRPGKPNKAASSFASAVIREPLNRVDYACPVGPETRMWCSSPGTVVQNLVLAHELPADAWGEWRAVNLPGISVTVQEMIDALHDIASEAVTNHISFEIDPAVERIVKTWPGIFDTARARGMGFSGDENIEAVIRQYIDDTGLMLSG